MRPNANTGRASQRGSVATHLATKACCPWPTALCERAGRRECPQKRQTAERCAAWESGNSGAKKEKKENQEKFCLEAPAKRLGAQKETVGVRRTAGASEDSVQKAVGACLEKETKNVAAWD